MADSYLDTLSNLVLFVLVTLVVCAGIGSYARKSKGFTS
jgi:hypothetical protein